MCCCHKQSKLFWQKRYLACCECREINMFYLLLLISYSSCAPEPGQGWAHTSGTPWAPTYTRTRSGLIQARRPRRRVRTLIKLPVKPVPAELSSLQEWQHESLWQVRQIAAPVYLPVIVNAAVSRPSSSGRDWIHDDSRPQTKEKILTRLVMSLNRTEIPGESSCGQTSKSDVSSSHIDELVFFTQSLFPQSDVLYVWYFFWWHAVFYVLKVLKKKNIIWLNSGLRFQVHSQKKERWRKLIRIVFRDLNSFSLNAVPDLIASFVTCTDELFMSPVLHWGD